MLAPNGLKLEFGVPLDGLLHVFDVLDVKRRRGTVLGNAHILNKPLVVKGQRGKHLERRGRHTTFVGRGVFEENGSGFFQTKLGILRNKKIGTLDNVRDGALAVDDEFAARLTRSIDSGRPPQGTKAVGQTCVRYGDGMCCERSCPIVDNFAQLVI